MTVGDLIDALSESNRNLPIRVLDGFNGGGTGRVINLGPHVINSAEGMDEEELEIAKEEGVRNSLEDLDIDAPCVIMGYGCY